MKFIHVGAVNPEVGHGGVEQFARDLRDVVGKENMLFLNYEGANAPPWAISMEKNKQNLKSGIIESDDIVIADGYYGLGLEKEVARLIIVCHGSYAGMRREYQINPPPSYGSGLESWLKTASNWQERAYRAGEAVAVSESAAYDLYDIYGIDASVIRNGVDVDKYQAIGLDSLMVDAWVEVAGNDERKGSDVIKELNKQGKSISRLGFEGEKWERWQRFANFIRPSRYEGASYASLEAMACNLNIVAYRSGLFDIDVPDEYFIGTYDFHPRSFSSLMKEAEKRDDMNPIQWVLENATLEHFASGWKKFLEIEDEVSTAG